VLKATALEDPKTNPEMLQHFEQLALYHVFEIDPDAEELEREKAAV
jgi:hypothetical protein